LHRNTPNNNLFFHFVGAEGKDCIFIITVLFILLWKIELYLLVWSHGSFVYRIIIITIVYIGVSNRPMFYYNYYVIGPELGYIIVLVNY